MTQAHDRYHRQSLLPEIGSAGQAAIGRSTVAVVGVGALGCASADVLARAGVGRLILIDRDIVELTNLQRQGLFTEADAQAGAAKANAARQRLSEVNSDIDIAAHVVDVSAENVEELLDECDVIVDGTDNFETRYLLNDLAVSEEIPLVIGGAVGTRGTITPVLPGHGPCLRCLHSELPVQHETCDTAGVLGPIVQMIGVRQAAIALRLIVEGADALPVQVEEFDAWTGNLRQIDLGKSRDADCVCCGLGQHEFLDGKGSTRTTKLCGRGAVQIVPAKPGRADLGTIADSLARYGEVTTLDGLVRSEIAGETADGGEMIELTVFEDGRAIVRGTEDAGRAKSIYSRYVGS